MKKMLAIAGLVVSVTSSVAMAQERAGDAALGALSGAVVLGPIGAVAGAVVGYTAGPAIARSWGLRSNNARRGRPAKQATQRRSAPDSKQLSARNQVPAPTAAPQRPAPPAAPARSPSGAAPPIQGFE